MKRYTEKEQRKSSQSDVNERNYHAANSDSLFQFVDNRVEAVVQRKLQTMADNSLEAWKGAQLQALTGSHSMGNTSPVQRVIKRENKSSQNPLPDKFTNAIDNFINVVSVNDSLKFLSESREDRVLMEIVMYDALKKAEGYTRIQVKGSGKIKTDFKSTGSSLGGLRELLGKGTPKRINIEIAISYDSLKNKSEAYIASVLAHEVGTHLAPYAAVLEKVANSQKLSSGEIGKLETAHGTNHEQVDHKALHNGYLKVNWSPFYQKPIYRELIEALVKTRYNSPEEIKEIWDEYIADVSRYDMSTGKPGAKNESSQLVFYREYENYRRGKGGYPVLKKVAANKGFTVATLIGILLIMYLMFQVGGMIFGSNQKGEEL